MGLVHSSIQAFHNSWVEGFIISLAASLVAIGITLWIERLRQPKLVAIAGDAADVIPDYQDDRSAIGPLKFGRLLITNASLPWPLTWARQTAEECRATLEIHNSTGSKRLFVYSGRWASTPELPDMTPDQWRLKALHPDPISIPAGSSEPLDVLVWFDITRSAYGWNNEAYLAVPMWKTERLAIPHGKHRLKVTINTQNGKRFFYEFTVRIGKTMETVTIEPV